MRKGLLISTPIIFLALVLSLFTVGFKGVAAQSQGNCNQNADLKDESNPFSITAPEGKVITSLTIKTGQAGCLGPYTSNGTYEDDLNGPNACYLVSGIGTQIGSAERVGDGEGSTCQEISHIEVEWGDPQEPTPTPTDVQPTPTEAEPTPTEAEPTPTEGEPTPTNTPGPTDTPTPTPTGQVAGTSTSNDPGDPSDPGDPGDPGVQGQVLGASTLAATGVKTEILYSLGLFLIGIALYGYAAPKVLEEY